jgi:hypothetical protein
MLVSCLKGSHIFEITPEDLASLASSRFSNVLVFSELELTYT